MTSFAPFVLGLLLTVPDEFAEISADLYQFPSLPAIKGAIRANLAFQQYAQQRAALTLEPNERQRWLAARQDARDRLTVWELLHAAKGGMAEEEIRGIDTPAVRELSLASLMTEIGEDAFWRGEMPLPVPVMEWRW